MNERWLLIVNPASGNGKGKRIAERALAAMRAAGLEVERRDSERPGHLVELTAEAVEEGWRKLALLGGDGTANECVNGLLRQQATPSESVTLGLIGVGTGNDWLRTIGVPKRLSAAIDLLAHGEARPHDVGVVEWEGGIYAGDPVDVQNGLPTRYFINIAGLGYDGHVTRNVAGERGRLAGTKFAYWKAIVSALFGYKHSSARISVDGVEASHPLLSVAVGICRYNGGGMMQLPRAEFDDGLLDVTLIGSMPKWQMVANLPRMLNGSFTRLDTVHEYRGREIRIESDPPVWLEVDGEVLGKCPARISVIPAALQVIMP